MASAAAGGLYPSSTSMPSTTSGASAPPSPGSLATPVATVPMSKLIAPMLDAMESLGASVQDPAVVAEYMRWATIDSTKVSPDAT